MARLRKCIIFTLVTSAFAANNSLVPFNSTSTTISRFTSPLSSSLISTKTSKDSQIHSTGSDIFRTSDRVDEFSSAQSRVTTTSSLIPDPSSVDFSTVLDKIISSTSSSLLLPNASVTDSSELPSSVSTTALDLTSAQRKPSAKNGSTANIHTDLASSITNQSISSSATQLSPTMPANSTELLPTFNVTMLGNSSNIISAARCWESSALWHDAATSFANYHFQSITATDVEQYATSYSNPNATSFYTLCDGVPRANVPQYITGTTSKTQTYLQIVQTQSYPSPTPTCSIKPSDCSVLSSFSNSMPFSLPTQLVDLEPCYPLIDPCRVEGGAVRLLYWPAATVVGSLCNSACPNPYRDAKPISSTLLCPACSASRSVVMPSVEDIVTAIVDGHTLTSPTVYYSFNYLRSLVGDLNLGTTVPNQIIPVNSADVSTMPCLPGPVPVLNTQYHAIDWSNLNAPVPAQAICCSGNLTDKQVTVYDDYAPILSIPQQVLEIDPAWSTCVPYFGVFDPPHALQGTPVAASPINTFAPDPTAIPETKAAPLPGPTARPAAPTATEPPPAPSSTPVVSNSGTLPSQSPAADPQSEQSGGSGPDSSNPASSAEDPLDPSEGGSSRHGDSPSDGNNDGRSDSESEVAGQGAGGAVASIMNDSPSSVPHAKSTSILISGGVDQGRSPGDVIGSVLAMPQGSGDSDADPSENSRGGDISQGGEFGSELGSGTSRGQSNENDASRNSGNNNEDASAASSVNNQESSDSGSQGHANDGPAGNQKLPASIIIGPSVIELPPDPSGHGVILPNGENLNPGQATTLGGTRISLAPGATAVEVGSKTIALSASSDVEVTEGAVQTEEAPAATQAVLTVGGSAVTAIERPGPSGETVAVVQGATLGVGGQLVTLRNGEVLSAGSHGVEVVDGGKTVAASWAPVPYNDASPAMTQALLTLDGTLITVSETPGPSGHTLVAVDGQTLTVGGRGAIVDGETLSAGDDGIVVVDGSSTSTASWSIDTSSSEIPEAVLTFDDGSIVTVTEKPGLSGHRSVVVVDGETLTVGGSAVEVNGELLSAGTNGIIVVDGGKTSTVPWKTTTGTSGSATGSGNGNYASRTGAASPLAGIPSAGRPRIDTRMANGVLGCWTAVAFAVLFVICL